MIDFDEFTLKLEADSEDEYQPTTIKEESLVCNSLDEYSENDGQPLALSTPDVPVHAAPNSSWFQCIHCKMLTLCKTTFDRHVQICGQNSKQYLCSNCKGDMEQQYQNRKLWECNVCPFKTYHLALFVLHRKNHKIKLRLMKRHKKTVYFQCENCEFQTKVRDRLLEHKKLHFAQMIKETQVIPLPETVTKTTSDVSENDLMLLKECHIIKQQVHPCRTCMEANHVVQKEEEPTVNAKVDCHRCDQCNYRSRSKIRLQKHMKTHVRQAATDDAVKQGLMYHCNSCDHSSKIKSELLKPPNSHKTFNSKQSIPTCSNMTSKTSHSISTPIRPEQKPYATRRSASKCSVDTAARNSQIQQSPSTPMLLLQRTRKRTEPIPQIKLSLEEGEGGAMEPITYVCSRCGYRGRNFHRYICHKEDMHGLDCATETNKCHKCQWNFPSNAKLLEHDRLHKLRIHLYRCSQCSYWTKKKSFFIKHFIHKHET